MDFSPPTTDYTRVLYQSLNLWQIAKEYNFTYDPTVIAMKRLLTKGKQDVLDPDVTDGFRQLVIATHPIWVVEAEHNRDHSLELRLGFSYSHVGTDVRLMSEVLNMFYMNAYGKTEAEAMAMADRIDEIFNTAYPAYIRQEIAVSQAWMTSSYPLTELEWFLEHPANFPLPYVLTLLKNGYSEALLRTFGSRLAHLYTADEADFLLRIATRNQLKRLLSIKLLRAYRPPSADQVSRFLQKGFTTGQELLDNLAQTVRDVSSDECYERVLAREEVTLGH